MPVPLPYDMLFLIFLGEIRFMQKRILLSFREQKYAVTNHLMPDLHVTLPEDVDPEALEKAVHSALALHPVFCYRIVRESDGLFYYLRNEVLPVVTEAVPGHTIYYGTEEFGFYPWQIMYSGKNILLSGTHAISDGTGYLSFLKSILHLYFVNLGHEFSPAAASDLKPAADPGFCPVSAASVLPCDPPGIPSFPPATPADDSYFETDLSKLKPQRLILRKNDIRNYATAQDVSTFSIISCYAARAVQQALRLGSGIIKVRVAANLRSWFPYETDRNFSMGFPLNYDIERLDRKPSPLIATAFRSQLDLLTDRDNLIRKLHNEKLDMERLRKDPGNLDGLRDAFRAGRQKASANIYYTHFTRPGFSAELEDLIEGFEGFVTPRPEKSLVIVASTFKQEITLNVYETLKGNALSRALENVIRADGTFLRCEPAPVFPRAEHITDQF